MSTTAFDTTINQARDLLRWRSPLRTELWAARLTADLEAAGDDGLLAQLVRDDRTEARLTLAALAALHPIEDEATAPPPDTAEGETTDGDDTPTDSPAGTSVFAPYRQAGVEATGSLAGWVARMGQVSCDGAWYGPADRYGEQTLAALAFRYADGKEPHLLVVAIDQVHGGLAVDAVVEEPKFLDDLDLVPTDPGVVAGRILDAFEVTDLVLGAEVAETLPAVRPLALSRARAVPDPVRHPVDDLITRFHDLPDLPGAREAFEKLVEFLGDRPLWWSPARVTRFLTSWLPREAILSDAAVAAMPDVVRAWTRHHGDHPEILRRIDEDAPHLPALMADDSLASLGKRIAQQHHP
ncbi:hypothetical protein [Nonomuraea ceibae]|uniref:hypothetical protein n=1 Tax=Nonomuraea ceibae TaxID=1935170 RepID=UPI001C5D64AB|nr:hypothetical protein [Nonomuraea ceibae]